MPRRAWAGYQTSAPLPPDHHKDAREAGERRRGAGNQERPEIQLPYLADQDVLRIADDGRRRTGIGAAGQCDYERARVETALRHPGAQQRGHREHDHVVGEHRRENAASGDSAGEQCRRWHGGARDPRRAPVVEAAGGELGRENHQPEQNDQGWEIDRCERRGAIDGAAAVEHDCAEQSDTGAIDLEPRPAAERHAEIHGREDDEDEAGQTDGVTAAGTSAAASRPVRSAGARH